MACRWFPTLDWHAKTIKRLLNENEKNKTRVTKGMVTESVEWRMEGFSFDPNHDRLGWSRGAFRHVCFRVIGDWFGSKENPLISANTAVITKLLVPLTFTKFSDSFFFTLVLILGWTKVGDENGKTNGATRVQRVMGFWVLRVSIFNRKRTVIWTLNFFYQLDKFNISNLENFLSHFTRWKITLGKI